MATFSFSLYPDSSTTSSRSRSAGGIRDTARNADSVGEAPSPALGAVLLDPDVGDDELRARLLSTVPAAQLREPCRNGERTGRRRGVAP